MKQITLQGAILIGVIIVCLSAVGIALITDDDGGKCVGFEQGMLHRGPPPPRFGDDHNRPPRQRRGPGNGPHQ